MKKRARTALIIIVCVLAALYITAAELLWRTALEPDFMRKLDAFEDFTRKGYSEQVYTPDIVKTESDTSRRTSEWLAAVGEPKAALTADDGTRLIAAMFAQPLAESGGSGDAGGTAGGASGGESGGTADGDAGAATETADGDVDAAAAALKPAATDLESIDPDAPWVLMLHGYTGWKEEQYPVAMEFYERGWSVLVPDLRAHGESEGKYIGMGYADMDDELKWLDAILNVSPDADIVLFGRSMGASAALQLAASDRLPENVRCVISDSAFRDPIELFSRKMKEWTGLPTTLGLVDAAALSFRLHGGYDLHDAAAINAVPRIPLPVLFIQGTEDKIVPVENAYILYEACGSALAEDPSGAPEKELQIFEGAGHCQSADKDRDRYYGEVFGFIIDNIW